MGRCRGTRSCHKAYVHQLHQQSMTRRSNQPGVQPGLRQGAEAHLQAGVPRQVQVPAGAARVAHHVPQHPRQARLLCGHQEVQACSRFVPLVQQSLIIKTCKVTCSFCNTDA
jgi:hypothetical protein